MAICIVVINANLIYYNRWTSQVNKMEYGDPWWDRWIQ